ncbi:MAG TPA: family 10 glycosylhydrolase [Ignavibacteriaceae bacterium]|nr:family 10 glycosylhydrolase [Ignavibacteriaceae bacterium]
MKLKNRIKKFLIILFILTPVLSVYSQPKEEVRALWVATVYGLDWPKTSGASAQKNEMITLLNKIQAANYNTIMLQVRARGDMLYPSAIEPWAKSLTSVLGSNPGYDPLQFTIEEAHKRGIEVHAWWNVYKVYGTGTPPVTNPKHVVLQHPELCKLYSNEWWMDPGIPETRTYLLNLAMEMVRKYDIDAIHFDFIRYPNPDFDDAQTYAQYGQGVNKSDWRRANINQFVTALYDSVQAVKPRMKVGSAPIGIYKDLSTCNSGWDGYTQIFQDSRRWVLAKKHDYLAPQIYWDINTCPRYDTLAMDWINNSAGRHLYPAIASYRMAAGDGNWPASEILAQVDSTRLFGGHGNVYYRAQSILDNWKDVYNLLKNGQYKYPANIPSMAWKDSTKPNTPGNLAIATLDSLTYTLTWNKPLPASDGDTAVYYNLYRDYSSPVNLNDIKNVIKFRIVNDTSAVVTFTTIPSENIYFTVTAYDRGYNESLPSNEAGIIVNSIEDEIQPGGFSLEQNFPNPFNPTTMISYRLPVTGHVALKIFDVLGNEITKLVNEVKEPGTYNVEWNAAGISSGIYFYRIQSGNFSSVKKLVIMK